MSADFSTYDINELRANPRMIIDELGGGVIGKIAERFGYELPVDVQPHDLYEFVAAIGPSKVLQENIEHIEKLLGFRAMDIAGDWLDESGCMKELNRPFAGPHHPRYRHYDAAIITGGVARWMLRRLGVMESIDPTTIGRVWLPVGIRNMKLSEHALVGVSATRRYGPEATTVTEEEFMRDHITGPLNDFFRAETYPVDSTNGDKILEAFFSKHPELTGKRLLVIGNAPNTVQATSQVYLAARKVNPSFNVEGDQLAMRGDTFPIGRYGEPASTHQNPISGITQLVRLAALLAKVAQV
jgi:hypothetical protein